MNFYVSPPTFEKIHSQLSLRRTIYGWMCTPSFVFNSTALHYLFRKILPSCSLYVPKQICQHLNSFPPLLWCKFVVINCASWCYLNGILCAWKNYYLQYRCRQGKRANLKIAILGNHKLGFFLNNVFLQLFFSISTRAIIFGMNHALYCYSHSKNTTFHLRC